VDDQMTVASAHEVIAVEPVIRRVVAARAANPADIDDLVQDCLERLLTARSRLAPEALVPYAVVTARNLVSSHARSAMRHAAVAPRILDAAEPDQPEDLLLTGEVRRAMTAALSQLSAQERNDLLSYYSEFPAVAGPGQAAAGPGQAGGGPAPAVAARTPGSRGALRVRMARTRAKLRLEYVLAFRHLELPTPRCRGVLLAISAGDTRRQRELQAGQHLLDCATCATLSEPLDRRSVALTAIAIPGGLVAWAASKARAHPLHAAGSVAAGSAAIAGAVLLQSAHHRPVPPPPRPAASPRVETISQLAVDGRPVRDTQAATSLRPLVGEAAVASGVSVVAAVTRNGFWIGTAQARIWVQLTGPLRPLHIHAGDRVRFRGTVSANPAGYPARAGLTDRADGQLLTRQGAHLTVSTTRISVVG
jgi:RNA polymerase sigma factor (sigma-70 family)